MTCRPLVGIVRRPHDAFQRVTADAIEQPRLLLFGAGNAHHPLGVGELAGQIFGLVELDVSRGFRLWFHHRFGWSADIVSDRTDTDRKFTRFEAVLREAVTALRVGGYADLDDRAGLPGGDDDTFHVAFGLGAYGAGQCRLVLRPSLLNGRSKKHHRCTGGQAQHQLASHPVLPRKNSSKTLSKSVLVALTLDSLGIAAASIGSRQGRWSLHSLLLRDKPDPWALASLFGWADQRGKRKLVEVGLRLARIWIWIPTGHRAQSREGNAGLGVSLRRFSALGSVSR